MTPPRKILVVDDEEVIRNYVSRALASRGYEVQTAVNGAEALAAAKKTRFDAAICDLKMPDMRGEEVIRQLAVLLPDARMIVITGSVSNLSDPLVPGVKTAGHLIKPFGINDIRTLVEKALSA
jgi:CheY-like chemotaxis protein